MRRHGRPVVAVCIYTLTARTSRRGAGINCFPFECSNVTVLSHSRQKSFSFGGVKKRHSIKGKKKTLLVTVSGRPGGQLCSCLRSLFIVLQKGKAQNRSGCLFVFSDVHRQVPVTQTLQIWQIFQHFLLKKIKSNPHHRKVLLIRLRLKGHFRISSRLKKVEPPCSE